MKIGIFGGAFNPVHNGHMNISLKFMNELSLDKLLIIPTGIPPHKSNRHFASAKDRLQMLHLAFDSIENVEITDMEIKRQGKSYTYDTIMELRKIYGTKAELFLIIGTDQFYNFSEWYRYEDILSEVTVCCCERTQESKSQMEMHSKTLSGRFYIADFVPVIVSSTEIRNMVNSSDDFSSLVPQGVFDYIISKNLYIDSDYKNKVEFYKETVKNRLSDKRYNHSLNVAFSARHLAELYGADINNAYIAGILHDIMKEEKPDVQIEYLIQNGDELTAVERINTRVLHQKSGELYCKLELGVDNDEILKAIRYHTTGRRNMSLLEKILYVADFISADRAYPDVDIMRKKAEISLEEAMLYSLQYTLKDLVSGKRLVHPDTLECYNYLLENYKC